MKMNKRKTKIMCHELAQRGVRKRIEIEDEVLEEVELVQLHRKTVYTRKQHGQRSKGMYNNRLEKLWSIHLLSKGSKHVLLP